MPLKNAKLTYLFEVEAKKENLIPNMLRRGRLLKLLSAARPP
jgi:hypothetical protein